MANVMHSANSSSPAASSSSHGEVTNPSVQPLSSITVQNITIGMDDSRSLRQSLERHFSSASRTHIHSLCSKIQTIQKGDSSMTDYLNSFKEIYDKLAAAEEPISKSDLVADIVYVLSDEYESFVDSIETRTESVNTDELHGLLLSKEISLQKRKTRTHSSSSALFHAYTA
ncbi:uncharacterized protein LOC126601245 [Malus sylvestris]|uniref:uncharacterized protein LOC126601245 n=1 Tax=Malus sylvestris TaxID=3752 RepID=UPI0021AD1703|nr:uncharacterized protein LOC126601245 [Malus sylvestris]